MTSKQVNVLFGVVIVILLGVVGYMAFGNGNSQDETLSQEEGAIQADLESNGVSGANSSSQTASTTTEATAGWKTYESSRLGLSFQYPASWGSVEETYYDSEKDGIPNSEISAKGKHVSISFSGRTGVGPYLSAASPDYTQWEGFVYKGDTSLENLYASFSEYKTKPVYFTAAPSTRLMTLVCYPNCAAGFTPEVPHVEAYAKLSSGEFGGISVSEILGNPAAGGLTDQAAGEFIQKAENSALDKDMQSKVDEFKTFVSTFKFAR